MKHKGTVTIETERLCLRAFELKDIEPAFRNWTSDDAVTEYLRWSTHRDISVTEMVIKDWIEESMKTDFYQWAIVLKEFGTEPIGNIAVVSWVDRMKKAQIGYCLGQQWWYQGIMTEALNAVIDFLINEIGMKRIEAYHDVRNIPSGAVMQKCGMVYEGTLRQSEWNNQGVCDAAWYAILAE